MVKKLCLTGKLSQLTNFKIAVGVILCLSVVPVIIVAVGVMLIKPYNHTKHIAEDPTTCTVNSVEYTGAVYCTCRHRHIEDCASEYPCLLITVNYTDTETGNTITNATLYEGSHNYVEMKHDMCSAYKCELDLSENDEHVFEFEREYGQIGRSFPCHPGSVSEPEALISVIHLWHILLGMLLPVGVIIFCSFWLVVYLSFLKERVPHLPDEWKSLELS